jgi:hypothetical protein
MAGKTIQKYLFILIVAISTANCCYSQKWLVFENIHTLKNYKYHPGEKIRLSMDNGSLKIEDEIYDLTDSSMILLYKGEVMFSQVSAVYRQRYWIDLISGFSMLAGVAYFGIDTFNRMINEEWPMVDDQSLAISVGLVTFGAILLPFRVRKIPVNENWKFKTLDPMAF